MARHESEPTLRAQAVNSGLNPVGSARRFLMIRLFFGGFLEAVPVLTAEDAGLPGVTIAGCVSAIARPGLTGVVVLAHAIEG